MSDEILKRLYELETTPEALEQTRDYLVERLRKFLQPKEEILICYPNQGPASLGGLLEQVALACDCRPVFWGPDYRWKALLRQAFSLHTITIFAPPLVVLGLMKMAKATSTPLYIHNALLSGYPYANWMVEGIKRGLDCRIWGCYLLGDGPVVAGFTCGQEAGIHIRDALYEPAIYDENGELMEDAQRGRLLMKYRPADDLVYDTQETAKLWHQPCSCGCDDPRIVETIYVGDEDPAKRVLEERFLAWTSILDYRVRQTESGIDLELVVFPGEPIPRIPNCAKLTVRPWNPEEDMPFCMEKYRKVPEKDLEKH
ncbi:MAG: hypothetical protein IJX69_04510 [Oscillospiraceae bacterium]|nr:hypothetical protein [Oscillospiraceae bacterium]